MPFSNRRNRLKRRHSHLRRASKKLAARLVRTHRIAIFSATGALFLGTMLLGFVVFERDTAVPLGVGTAGLRMPDTTLVSNGLPDSLRRHLMPTPSQPQPARANGAGRHIITGQGSYYGADFSGRRTASGEVFDPNQLTAAHRTLPFGTRLRVTNVRNGRSIVVRINDRGPFTGNRVIDLSHAAAGRIGMLASGTAQVRLDLLSR
jgi:rare lipoprotein A